MPNCPIILTVNNTARSLLHFFGTWLEWGQRGTLGIHDASPELMALTMAILDVVPAAWQSYGKGRDDGWVDIYQPHPDRDMADYGFSHRHVAVHNVPCPPRWVAPDGAHASHVTVIKATVAALVGLANPPKAPPEGRCRFCNTLGRDPGGCPRCLPHKAGVTSAIRQAIKTIGLYRSQLATCEASNEWPGYSLSVVPFEVEESAWDEVDDDDLAADAGPLESANWPDRAA